MYAKQISLASVLHNPLHCTNITNIIMFNYYQSTQQLRLCWYFDYSVSSFITHHTRVSRTILYSKLFFYSLDCNEHIGVCVLIQYRVVVNCVHLHKICTNIIIACTQGKPCYRKLFLLYTHLDILHSKLNSNSNCRYQYVYVC